jgi:hypothetical protein
MKYVFLIGAEHQLFQVDIAISYFRIDTKDLILIVEKFPNNQTFIDKVNQLLIYGKVIVFENWTFIDLIKERRKHISFMDICFALSKFDVVFLASHYDSDSTLLFNSIVKPSLFYLMDEGTSSFSVQAQRNSFELITRFKIFIKSMLYKKRIVLPNELVYFTKFDFTLPMRDRKLLYNVLQNNNPLTILSQKELIFIGTAIVEAALIEESIYISCLAKVVFENKMRISKFYYYPHRNECIKKIDKITKIGFEIRYLDEPFELFFSKQMKIASIIASFYTTSVIFNIATSNYNLPILIIYKFDDSLLRKNRLVYENVYEAMKINKSIQFLEI